MKKSTGTEGTSGNSIWEMLQGADGIRQWGVSDNNMGIHTGTSGESFGPGEISSFGKLSSNKKINLTINLLKLILAKQEMQDHIDISSTTGMKPNSSIIPNEPGPYEKTFMRYYDGYNISHYGFSGKSGTLNIKDTTVYRKDSVKLQKKNEKVKREFNSHF